jgi:hypothetical protein
MTVEAASFISQLDQTKPAGTDEAYEGDDHLRLLKSVLRNSFGYVTGSVTVGQTELNYLTGLNANIVSLLAAKAPLASPTMTGTPTAPTAAAATNSTQVATTAFVQSQKASPVFTGTVTAPTPSTGLNNNQVATTQFVQSAVAGATGGVTAGKAIFFGSFN